MELPDPLKVRMLSKKQQILQNSYDGILKLDGPHNFHCYIKWILDRSGKVSNESLRLNFLLQEAEMSVQLNFQSIKGLNHPDTVALVEALSHNLQRAQNKQKNEFDMPLIIRNSSMVGNRNRPLDSLQDKEFFQSLYKFDMDKKLWRQTLKVSVQQFEAQVQTGDIILFQSKDFAPKMQRMLTGSQYDHVGIMIKYPKSGHLQILESLRPNGVNKWNWRGFLEKKWYQKYNKIVYRKLYLFSPTHAFEDREQFDKQVFKFVLQTVGSQFQLTSDALFHKNTYPNEGDISIPISKDRGFFCSELVALLYKRLGLIDP